MFAGKWKAIIAGKDREIVMLADQLGEAKRELAHLRDQLDRVYHAALGIGAAGKNGGINRPSSTRGMSENGLG
jgi:hypothetical protein